MKSLLDRIQSAAKAPGTLLTFKTADQQGAGTDANIFVILHGLKGDSREFRLQDHSADADLFERGDSDSFYLEHGELGVLYGLTVRSDGMYASSDWRLNTVSVRSFDKNKELLIDETLSVNEWLEEDTLKLLVPDVTIKEEGAPKTEIVEGTPIESDNRSGNTTLKGNETFTNSVSFSLATENGDQKDETTGIDFSYSAGAEAKGLKAGWELGLAKSFSDSVFSKVGVTLGQQQTFESNYEYEVAPGKRLRLTPKWERKTRRFKMQIGAHLVRTVALPESLAFAGVDLEEVK